MLPISRVIGHREWSPGRKSDPVFDCDWMRAGVAGIHPRTTAAAPPPRREDDDTVQIDITLGTIGAGGGFVANPAGLAFRGSAIAEVGDASSVYEAAWVRWAAHWGGVEWRIVFWDARGPIGEVPRESLTTSDNWPIPAGCRSLTVEGTREHPGVTLAAYLLQLPKR